MLSVAYLYSIGKTQDQIAELLDIGQTSVSRHCREAFSTKPPRLIPQNPRFDPTGLDVDTLAHIRSLVDRQYADTRERLDLLTQQAGVHPVKDFRVVHAVDATGFTTHEEYRRRLARFGAGACPRLDELIETARFVGCSAGLTIEAVVNAHGEHRPSSLQVGESIVFFPISAIMREHFTSNSASALAERLSLFVNRNITREVANCSLAGVPWRIPRRFKQKTGVPGKELTKADTLSIRNYIELDKGYRTVFVGDGSFEGRPVIDQMDMLITSVGSTNDKNTLITEIAENEGVPRDTIVSEAIGDMSGLLIQRGEDDRAVKQRNERTNGISLDQISEFSKQAARTDTKPGVVVLAVGEDKAPTLHKCIKLGLINNLIIDNGLYAALRSLLPAKEPFQK